MEVFECVEGVSIKVELVVTFVAFPMAASFEPFTGLVTTWVFLLLPFSFFDLESLGFLFLVSGELTIFITEGGFALLSVDVEVEASALMRCFFFFLLVAELDEAVVFLYFDSFPFWESLQVRFNSSRISFFMEANIPSSSF